MVFGLSRRGSGEGKALPSCTLCTLKVAAAIIAVSAPVGAALWHGFPGSCAPLPPPHPMPLGTRLCLLWQRLLELMGEGALFHLPPAPRYSPAPSNVFPTSCGWAPQDCPCQGKDSPGWGILAVPHSQYPGLIPPPPLYSSLIHLFVWRSSVALPS